MLASEVLKREGWLDRTTEEVPQSHSRHDNAMTLSLSLFLCVSLSRPSKTS